MVFTLLSIQDAPLPTMGILKDFLSGMWDIVDTKKAIFHSL